MFTNERLSYEPCMKKKKSIGNISAATLVEWNSVHPKVGKSVKLNKLKLWQLLKIRTIQPIYTNMVFALIHSFVINLKQYITKQKFASQVEYHIKSHRIGSSVLAVLRSVSVVTSQVDFLNKNKFSSKKCFL